MKRLKVKRGKTVQPYTWLYNGEYVNEKTDIQIFLYEEEEYYEETVGSADRIEPILHKVKPDEMVWFNIHGLNQPDIFPELLKLFYLPAGILNEVLTISRRSRIETQDGIIFFNAKTTIPYLIEDRVEIIPISFIVKDNLLMSFQDKKNALFEHIRERIRTKTGSVRRKKEDYLLYLMLDAILENFFLTLDEIEDKIDDITSSTKLSHKIVVLVDIQTCIDNLSVIKRAVLPLKDVLFNIKNVHIEENNKFLDPANQIYFDRAYHKVLEILDQIDYDTRQLDSASSYFFSMQSHRMNMIMKVLTIVSVIFMPLTFIVGVYGMNFEYMPEIGYKYSYFIVWAVMLFLVIGMVYYFKRKHWF